TLLHRWHIFPQGPEMNPPDWSLSCEWAVSLLFPAFAAICLRGSSRTAVAVGIAALAIDFICLVGGHYVPTMLWQAPFPPGRCACEFALGMLLWRYRTFIAVPRYLSAALSVAPLFWLGEISYSIYLTHWPIIQIVGATLWVFPIALAVSAMTYFLIER